MTGKLPGKIAGNIDWDSLGIAPANVHVEPEATWVGRANTDVERAQGGGPAKPGFKACDCLVSKDRHFFNDRRSAPTSSLGIAHGVNWRALQALGSTDLSVIAGVTVAGGAAGLLGTPSAALCTFECEDAPTRSARLGAVLPIGSGANRGWRDIVEPVLYTAEVVQRWLDRNGFAAIRTCPLRTWQRTARQGTCTFHGLLYIGPGGGYEEYFADPRILFPRATNVDESGPPMATTIVFDVEGARNRSTWVDPFDRPRDRPQDRPGYAVCATGTQNTIRTLGTTGEVAYTLALHALASSAPALSFNWLSAAIAGAMAMLAVNSPVRSPPRNWGRPLDWPNTGPRWALPSSTPANFDWDQYSPDVQGEIALDNVSPAGAENTATFFLYVTGELGARLRSLAIALDDTAANDLALLSNRFAIELGESLVAAYLRAMRDPEWADGPRYFLYRFWHLIFNGRDDPDRNRSLHEEGFVDPADEIVGRISRRNAGLWCLTFKLGDPGTPQGGRVLAWDLRLRDAPNTVFLAYLDVVAPLDGSIRVPVGAHVHLFDTYAGPRGGFHPAFDIIGIPLSQLPEPPRPNPSAEVPPIAVRHQDNTLPAITRIWQNDVQYSGSGFSSSVLVEIWYPQGPNWEVSAIWSFPGETVFHSPTAAVFRIPCSVRDQAPLATVRLEFTLGERHAVREAAIPVWFWGRECGT